MNSIRYSSLAKNKTDVMSTYDSLIHVSSKNYHLSGRTKSYQNTDASYIHFFVNREFSSPSFKYVIEEKKFVLVECDLFHESIPISRIFSFISVPHYKEIPYLNCRNTYRLCTIFHTNLHRLCSAAR